MSDSGGNNGRNVTWPRAGSERKESDCFTGDAIADEKVLYLILTIDGIQIDEGSVRSISPPIIVQPAYG